MICLTVLKGVANVSSITAAQLRAMFAARAVACGWYRGELKKPCHGLAEAIPLLIKHPRVRAPLDNVLASDSSVSQHERLWQLPQLEVECAC